MLAQSIKQSFAGLASALEKFFEVYHSAHCIPPDTSLADVLCDIMNQKGMKQLDLPEISSQSLVSEILDVKREPNARQITGLVRRFGVSPTVFSRASGLSWPGCLWCFVD